MNSIDKAKGLMEARLAELEQERKAIAAALASLGRQTSNRPRRSKRRRRTATRVGRGERQLQFLNVVRQHPGEPMSAIARKMAVKPQQLYPIARRLSDEGTIAKFNGGYKAAAVKSNA